MENKKQEKLESQNLVLELSLRVSLKNYKIKITTKRAWVISLVLIIIRLWSSFIDSKSF